MYIIGLTNGWKRFILRLSKKYIFGCHTMFYELDMVGEYLDSIYDALTGIENPENVTIDMFYNCSEFFEKSEFTIEQLEKKIYDLEYEYENWGVVEPRSKIYKKNKPYTIADYRRDLNYNNCNDYDFIIWGESDCLVPKQFFRTMEAVSQYANDNDIHRYITTFALRKMWDDSWKVLEHPEFTDKPYYDMDTEEDTKKALNSPWSIRYTMSKKEIDEVNNKSEELDIRVIQEPKFEGSCLVISTDLIKSGANIPHGSLMVAEDTAFLESVRLHMGQHYIQFVIKNILKVHNRNHPKKRLNVKDEDKDKSTHFKRRDQKNNWYQILSKLSKENLGFLFHNQKRFNRYSDFEENI